MIISVNIFKARVLGINAWEHQIDETSILYSNMKMGGNCYITISFNNLFSSFDNVLCYLLILIKNKSFLKHSAIHIWCFLGHPDTRSKSFELPVPNKHTRFVVFKNLCDLSVNNLAVPKIFAIIHSKLSINSKLVFGFDHNIKGSGHFW